MIVHDVHNFSKLRNKLKQVQHSSESIKARSSLIIVEALRRILSNRSSARRVEAILGTKKLKLR
jgi:hypothetical protein